jgi:predicted DNA-binding protein
MATKTTAARNARARKTVRTSVTLPRDLYETLGLLAKDKRVTVAWIIRDASERYVGEAWPLLKEARP